MPDFSPCHHKYLFIGIDSIFSKCLQVFFTLWLSLTDFVNHQKKL